MSNNFSQFPFGNPFSSSQTSAAFRSTTNDNQQPPVRPFGFSAPANPPFQSFPHPLAQPFASAGFTPAAATQPRSENDPFAQYSESAFAPKPTSASFPNDPFNAPPSGDASQDFGSNNFGAWDSGQGSNSNVSGGRRPYRSRDRDSNSALFLNNVPLELFSQEAIAEHFRVGSKGVTNVSLRGSADSKRTAIINFESPEDAATALNTCSYFNGAPLNVSVYMTYAQRAAAAAAVGSSSGTIAMHYSSTRANSIANRPPPQSPPNKELVFSPVPRTLFSKEQIGNLFNSICPDKVENVLIRERRLPNGNTRRTAIVIMADVESATAALENLPLYEGEHLRVQYRAPRPARAFQPSGSRQMETSVQGGFAGSASQQDGFTGEAQEDDGDLDMVPSTADQQDEPVRKEADMVVDGGGSSFQYQQDRDQTVEHWEQNVSQEEVPIDEPALSDTAQEEHTRKGATRSTHFQQRTSARKLNRRSGSKGENANEAPKNHHLDRPNATKLVTADSTHEIGEWRRGEKIDLSQAKSMVGTCRTMCPEDEMKLRGKQEEFSRFEATGGKFDRSKAVKKYRRSAAISEAPRPDDIRPPDVLVQTMDHLRQVCDEDEDFAQIHLFVRDRTRSLRQDFTYQGVKDETCIQVHEEAVRFHILSEQLLSELPPEQYSGAQNHEQLDKCLISLREMYDLRRENELSTSPNEPEMQAYYMLLHMTDQQKFIQLLSGFDKQVRESAPVQFAIRVMGYAQLNSAGNPVLFFRCVEGAPYLAACLLKRRFPFVRHSFIGDVASSLGTSQGPDSIPIATLTNRLGLENDNETLELFRFMEFTVVSTAGIDSEIEYSVVCPSRAAQVDKIFDWKPGPARRLVDNKGDGLRPSQIITGEGTFVTWGLITFGGPSPLKERSTPPLSKRRLLRLSMGEPPRNMVEKYEQFASHNRNAFDMSRDPDVTEGAKGVPGIPLVLVPESHLSNTSKTPCLVNEKGKGSNASIGVRDISPSEKGERGDERSGKPLVVFPKVVPVPEIWQSQPSEPSPWFNASSPIKPFSGSRMAVNYPLAVPDKSLNITQELPKPVPDDTAVDPPHSQTMATENSVPPTYNAANDMIPTFSNAGESGFLPMEEKLIHGGPADGNGSHELEVMDAIRYSQGNEERSQDFKKHKSAAVEPNQVTPDTPKISYSSAILATESNAASPRPTSCSVHPVADKPEADFSKAPDQTERSECIAKSDPSSNDLIMPVPVESTVDGSKMGSNKTTNAPTPSPDPKSPVGATEAGLAMRSNHSDVPPIRPKKRKFSVKDSEEMLVANRRKYENENLPSKERDLLLQIRDSMNSNLSIIEKSVDKMRGRYSPSIEIYSKELTECERLLSLLEDVGKVAQDAKDASYRLDCREQWVGESLSLFAASLNVCPMRQASLLWDEVSAFRQVAELQQERVDLNVVRIATKRLGVSQDSSVQLRPVPGKEKPGILREHEVRTQTGVTHSWKRRSVAPLDLISIGRKVVDLNAMFWQGAVINLSGDAREANMWMQTRLSGWTSQSSGVLKVFRINDLNIDRYVSVVSCEEKNSVPESATFLGFTVDVVPEMELGLHTRKIQDCLETLALKNKGLKKARPVACVVIHDPSNEPESARKVIQGFTDSGKFFTKDHVSQFVIVNVKKETIEDIQESREVVKAIIASAELAKWYDFSKGIEPKLKPLGETAIQRCEKAWKPLVVFAKTSETVCSAASRVITSINKAWSRVASEMSQIVRRVPVEVGARRADVIGARDAIVENAKLPYPQDIKVLTPCGYLDWMKGYVERQEPYTLGVEQDYDPLWKFCLALDRMIPAFLRKKLGDDHFESHVWTLVEKPSAEDLERYGLVEQLFCQQDRRYLGVLKRSITIPDQTNTRRRSCGDEYEHTLRSGRGQGMRTQSLQDADIGTSNVGYQPTDDIMRRRTMHTAYDTLIEECEAYQSLIDGTLAELHRRQRDAENRRKLANAAAGMRLGHSL